MPKYGFEDTLTNVAPINKILKISGTITKVKIASSGKVKIDFNPMPIRNVSGGFNLNGDDEFKDLSEPVNDLGLGVTTLSVSPLDFSVFITYNSE